MKKIKLGMEQSYCGIGDLFERVAEVLGYEDTDNLHYDPTKINVAKNIFYNVEAFYKSIGFDDYKLAFGMDWACYGPKTDDKLQNDEVTIEKGFITQMEA